MCEVVGVLFEIHITQLCLFDLLACSDDGGPGRRGGIASCIWELKLLKCFGEGWVVLCERLSAVENLDGKARSVVERALVRWGKCAF